MAIIIPTLDGATYLRFDGVRIDLSPERRGDGAMTVPPTRKGEVHLYAYRSAAARSARDAPLWDAAFAFALEDIPGLALTIAPGTAMLAAGPCYQAAAMATADLWAGIYALVADAYPPASIDFASRGAAAGLLG